MLIVSDFHDYYDTSIGYGGIDKTIVYNRKQIEAYLRFKEDRNTLTNSQAKEFEKCLNVSGTNFNVSLKRVLLQPFIVGFCGNLYPGCYFTSYTPASITNKIEYIYDYNTLKEYALSINWEIPNQLKEFLIKGVIRNDTLFIKHQIPVFLVTMEYYFLGNIESVVFNPCLKTLGFMKLVDPFQAHQSLMMYISGVLSNQDKMNSVISDQDLLLGKGFDKWSFRKPGKNS